MTRLEQLLLVLFLLLGGIVLGAAVEQVHNGPRGLEVGADK